MKYRYVNHAFASVVQNIEWSAVAATVSFLFALGIRSLAEYEVAIYGELDEAVEHLLVCPPQ